MADNLEHPRPSPPLGSILPESGARAVAKHTVGEAMGERAPARWYALGGSPSPRACSHFASAQFPETVTEAGGV